MIEVRDINAQLDKVIHVLEELKPKGKLGSQVVRMSAFNTLSLMKPRISGKGQAADGSKIGLYSTKPMYVALSQSPQKFDPLGKSFKGKRRNKFESGKNKGKNHASRYFQGGYAEFKSLIGRNTLGSVNLTLTGQFMNAMNVMATKDGFGIGWPNNEFADRARHFESSKMYGKSIFGLAPKERKKVVKEAKRIIQNAVYR